MSRPQKRRRICAMPHCTSFSPQNGGRLAPIQMTLDEYETIRLIDLEDMTQEQCSAQMGVARTTVQAIYASARKKLADCIINGLLLIIAGGEYRLAEHPQGYCGRGCRHRRCSQQYQEAKEEKGVL